MSGRFCMCLIVIGLFAMEMKTQAEDTSYVEGSNQNLAEALQFLREYDREASGMCYRVTSAQWNFSTNITANNRRQMLDEQGIQAKFQRISWRKATTFAWSRLPDPIVRRQMRRLATEGRAALHDHQYEEVQQLVSSMKEVYSRAKICGHNSKALYCDLTLEPSLTRILAHSRDFDEQLYVWKAWRDAVGPPIRDKYVHYVQLANQAARLDGFFDAGEQMRSAYESADFEENIMQVWTTIEPLYRELHAYVRRRLVERYGTQRVRPNGPIPAHLLGNMWAQNWRNVEDLVMPYPGKTRGDITPELLRQGYNPLKYLAGSPMGDSYCNAAKACGELGVMFQAAEEFFTSMGLKPMPPEFWRYSLIEKPVDREVVCRASAWDFCNHVDYRIKQCTEVTADDFFTTHHEMAHIQYYLQYADQPFLFRTGANPAFHEALGDVVAMSVQTPRHLQRIGLINNITDDYETNINFLLSMALDKVVYLPFALIVDKWRWKTFAEGVRDMNARWWELRLAYQGLVPPLPRTERDFDPASKYHIPADTPYIRYFVSIVLQFQMYESLCEASGHYSQLHSCDIYRSREAGRILSDVLRLGSSRPWPEVIGIMTRGKTTKLDAQPLLDYFEPLRLWLQVRNKGEEVVGWTTTPQDTALFAEWFYSSSTNSTPLTSSIWLALAAAIWNSSYTW